MNDVSITIDQALSKLYNHIKEQGQLEQKEHSFGGIWSCDTGFWAKSKHNFVMTATRNPSSTLVARSSRRLIAFLFNTSPVVTSTHSSSSTRSIFPVI